MLNSVQFTPARSQVAFKAAFVTKNNANTAKLQSKHNVFPVYGNYQYSVLNFNNNPAQADFERDLKNDGGLNIKVSCPENERKELSYAVAIADALPKAE